MHVSVCNMRIHLLQSAHTLCCVYYTDPTRSHCKGLDKEFLVLDQTFQWLSVIFLWSWYCVSWWWMQRIPMSQCPTRVCVTCLSKNAEYACLYDYVCTITSGHTFLAPHSTSAYNRPITLVNGSCTCSEPAALVVSTFIQSFTICHWVMPLVNCRV